MMPCCHSALLIAPQCSCARTSLFVALINQVQPHTAFLTLDSPSFVRADLAGKEERVPPEGRNQSTNKNTVCLLNQLIKIGANPLLKMALAARKEITWQTLALFPHAGTSSAVCCLVSIGVRAALIRTKATVFHTPDSHY